MITQNTELDLVRNLVHGRWRGEVLAVALRLDLPDLVGERPRSTADLAAELEISRDGLGRLLRLLAAMGVLQEAGADRFTGTEASRMLRRDHPRSLRTEAMHVLSPWSRLAWDQLETSVRHGTCGFERATGTRLFEYLEAHPEEAAAFQAFQAVQVRRNFEALMGAGQVFPASGTVVDVGGGNGAMLRSLLGRVPGLSGVLYDQPGAIAQARSAAGGLLEGRLTLVEGDFFESVPAAADAYLLSHVLHDWPDAEASRILRTVAAAMRHDSTLVLMENVAAGGRAGIVFGYLDLLMLTSNGGRERTLDEHRALLEGAGLELVSHVVAEPRAGLSILTARRPLGG